MGVWGHVKFREGHGYRTAGETLGLKATALPAKSTLIFKGLRETLAVSSTFNKGTEEREQRRLSWEHFPAFFFLFLPSLYPSLPSSLSSLLLLSIFQSYSQESSSSGYGKHCPTQLTPFPCSLLSSFRNSAKHGVISLCSSVAPQNPFLVLRQLATLTTAIISQMYVVRMVLRGLPELLEVILFHVHSHQ